MGACAHGQPYSPDSDETVCPNITDNPLMIAPEFAAAIYTGWMMERINAGKESYDTAE